MKTQIRAGLAALLFGMAAVGAARAQTPPAGGKPPRPAGMVPLRGTVEAPPKGGGPGSRMRRFAKEINLTPAQQAKMESIVAGARKKVQTLRTDTKLSEAQKMEKLRALMKQTRDAQLTVLTPEQKKKWAEMRKKRQADGRRGSQGGSRLPGAPGKATAGRKP